MIIRKCGICVFVIVFVMLVSSCISGAASGQNAEQKKHYRRIDLGISIQDYKWAEYSEDGSKLLEETGFRYTLAFDFESLNKYVGWRNGVNLFLGQVDYKGQAWSELPVKTDVLYIGTKIYLDAVPIFIVWKFTGQSGFSISRELVFTERVSSSSRPCRNHPGAFPHRAGLLLSCRHSPQKHFF
ncbi:MAG: hypothetical protein ACKVE4_07605 [Dissulfuribacterales bacterium]